jgi:hypothetical protein
VSRLGAEALVAASVLGSGLVGRRGAVGADNGATVEPGHVDQFEPARPSGRQITLFALPVPTNNRCTHRLSSSSGLAYAAQL